jgi:hypothetical protein
VYRGLVGKPEVKRTLGRPRRRWEDNIKMNLQELGCGVWTGFGWLSERSYSQSKDTTARCMEIGRTVRGSNSGPGSDPAFY